MAEKVAKLGVPRDNNFMYYIKGGAVWRVPRKQPGMPKGKQEKVAEPTPGINQDVNFIYFLDKDGDISRAKRAVGGQKRKKTAAKAAKKPVKKVVKKAAKKAVKKAAKKPVKKVVKKAAKKPVKKPVKKGKRR